MAHGPKKQSTGSWDSKKDRHQKPVGRGQGQGPKATPNAYKPNKFKAK